jgi:hypothetical protein
MKQTLKQALLLARSGKSKALARAGHYLSGCPEGGWAETAQAMRRIRDELPLRSERDYTLDEFVSAAYIVDSADRYRSAL